MTFADLVEGKRGVKRPYQISQRSAEEHAKRGDKLETYHQLLFSYFSREITNEYAPFSFPFRCTSRHTRSPVELEGSTTTRHEHGRRSVETSENSRSFVRRGEGKKTVAGRWTAFHMPDEMDVNRCSYRTTSEREKGERT